MTNREHFNADLPTFAKFQVGASRRAKSAQSDWGFTNAEDVFPQKGCMIFDDNGSQSVGLCRFEDLISV